MSAPPTSEAPSESRLADEARYRALIEATSQGLWIWDPATRTGDFESMRRWWQETTGQEPGERFGADWLETVHPDDRERVSDAWRHALNTGNALDIEHRLVGRGGAAVHIRARGIPIRNADGSVREWVGMVADVSAQRRAEAAMRESATLLGVVGEAAPAFLWVNDPAGENLYINPAWFEYTGTTPADLRRLGYMNALHPEDRATAIAKAHEARRDGTPFEGEFRYRRHDGEYRWFTARSLPVRNEAGEVVKRVGVAVDIHDRKAHEDQLRALNETLEQRFAARTAQLRALAHELTQAEQRERKRIAQALHDDLAQSLAICRMKLSMIPTTAVPGGWARTLAEAGERLGEAIHQTRTLMHEMSPPMLYDLGLGAAIGGLVERVFQQHGLKVSVEASGQEAALDDNLRAFLFQAARELLINVVKYAGTDAAGVGIAQSRDELTLTVEDRGAGFDPAKLTWRPTDGGGFGLFNLRERLELLGGRLDIDSAPGKGTRVTLVAPVPTAADARIDPRAATPPDAAPAAVAGLIRVLLADDHKLLRDGLASLLSGLPDIAIVGEAEDGLAAIEQARRVQPDVVLMDISMPRLNGIEATRRLTAELPHVKVIGLSMHSEGDVAAAMRAAGAVAYLNKGGPAEALVEAIRQHASSRRPAMASR